MNMLVAGGTNFIGRTIADTLGQEHTVTVLNRGSAEPPSGAAHHVCVDRTDAAAIRVALGSHGPFDAVVDVSATEPSMVEGLLAGLGEALPDIYVLISSAAVYSPGVPFPRQEDAGTLGDPVWGGYGEAKAECEQLLRNAGIPRLTILRPPYLYGPGNNEDREKWLWSRLVNQRPVYVPSRGGSRIQFCHVSYLAAVVAAAVEDRISPDTYNIGERRAYSFDQYLDLLGKVSGHQHRVVHIVDAEVPARSFFPFRDIDLMLDVERLHRAYAEPGPDLLHGLAETWAWLERQGIPAYEPTDQESAWTSDSRRGGKGPRGTPSWRSRPSRGRLENESATSGGNQQVPPGHSQHVPTRQVDDPGARKAGASPPPDAHHPRQAGPQT